MTTSYPLRTVTMELAAQLEARNAELLLEWVPREANAEADRLADGVASGFSPELRVKASLSQIRWLALPGLLEAGATFQRGAAKMRSRAGKVNAKGHGGAGARARRKALRERDPW